MSVTREEVLRIAELAELHVDDDAVPALVEQMARILEYVARLDQVQAGNGVKPFVPGPDAIRLRADEVKPAPLVLGPAKMAPAFRDGLILVPRLDQFDDAERPA